MNWRPGLMLWMLSLSKIPATNIYTTGNKQQTLNYKIVNNINTSSPVDVLLLLPLVQLRICQTTTESEVECTGSDYKK